MDLLKLSFLFIFVSCAKLNYLVEQGVGQLRIQNRAKSNEDILKDPLIAPEIKRKIKKVKKLKSFFYNYFDKKETRIYSQTTFLKQRAATYLVIASRPHKIIPKKECFPFMGCFPYLGFFKEQSAFDYQKKMEGEGWVTYKRPAYAYSTLGYFTDPILSSFFYYDDLSLTELIFHELTHTIFFIKDEVDFNENIAQFIGREMALDYLKYSESKRNKLKEQEYKNSQLRQKMVELTQELSKSYQGEKTSKQVFEKFMGERFYPEMTKLCSGLAMGDKCFPLKGKWNNARFAAYMTYEKDSELLQKLRNSYKGDLKSFLNRLEMDYTHYQDSVDQGSFEDYLKGKL